MSNRTELLDLICQVLLESGLAAKEDRPLQAGDLSADTRLFGLDGLLDSIGLVSFVIDVEEQVNERFGCALTVVDDQAMSQERSPFRTIGSLTDYILELINEGAVA